jgi:biopolymer transport protein ExbD
VAPHGLDALAPQPPPPNQKADDDPSRTVVIQIAKDKTLKINQEEISWTKLEDRLIDIFKSRADKIVFVKGDPDLEFQTIATAIDIAHSAGIDKVGLMTPKVEEGK